MLTIHNKEKYSPTYCEVFAVVFFSSLYSFKILYEIQIIRLCAVIMWRRQWHPTPVLLLENPMDRGAWQAAVHGVAKSRTRLSDFTFTFHFHALEKEMATHSSVLAWRIPGTGVTPVGCRPWGHTESDTTEATQQQKHLTNIQ